MKYFHGLMLVAVYPVLHSCLFCYSSVKMSTEQKEVSEVFSSLVCKCVHEESNCACIVFVHFCLILQLKNKYPSINTDKNVAYGTSLGLNFNDVSI